MPTPLHTLTLLDRQTRMVNASEGLRLEVHSGCLWLTRPSDMVDRFLVAGASMELHENQVLIQSDRHPPGSPQTSAHFALVPLAVPLPAQSAAKTARRNTPLTTWLLQLRAWAQLRQRPTSVPPAAYRGTHQNQCA